RQGYKVACLEEIAYSQQWLSTEQMAARAELMAKNGYGQYLANLLKN
ncbi:glucose-1-phosphate thymidylyltransferase, partial [Escherichia coli]|nr:glucose-1-phosphate thymidylyltransferase [Escherichia coli]